MRQVSIELTEKCNNSCIHCYLKMRSCKSSNIVAIGDYFRILDWAKQNQVLFLTLTGGEPMLIPNFDQYYTYAVNEGFVVSVLTNGSMLSNEISKIFQCYPPYSVEISVYGMSNKTYHAMTQSNHPFDRVLHNALHLLNSNVKVVLKYVVAQENYEDIPAFVDWADSNHVDYTFTIANLPLRIASNSDKIDSSFRISHNQLIQLTEQFPSKISILPSDRSYSCDLGDILHFTASGKVQGCPGLCSDENYGIINKFSWEQITKPYILLREQCKFCPAWEQIESRKEIVKFLYGVSIEQEVVQYE